MPFAGSAIKQGAGVMADWDKWRPWRGEYLWLLMGGAMEPPKTVEVSERKSRNAADVLKSGKFLNGLKLDLRNMEQALIKADLNFDESVSQLKMKKKTAEDHLKELFENCKRQDAAPVVYYTGHGETGTGNWCFADGTISIQEICDMLPGGCGYPLIISDACYSGHWANYCLENPGKMHCLSAAPEFSTAWDTRDGGGELTAWMTGGSRPRTEPMWSKGSKKDFPITTGYSNVQYIDFISSHVYNNDKILISQTVCNNEFSGIFATDTLHKEESTSSSWRKRSAYKDFVTNLKDDVWKENKRIYSLAVDDTFGFGAFCISGFGNGQVILPDSSPDLSKNKKEISDYWKEGYDITAVGAKDSTFYVVMTRETKEFKGKAQKWFTKSTWGDVVESINEGYEENPGKIITDICYSTGQKKYLVVMTESKAGQAYKDASDSDRSTWMDEKYKEGFRPTIVFKANDPARTKPIHRIVMTTMPNITGYTYRHNYTMK